MEGRRGRENGMREHGWQWGMEDAGNGGRVSRAVVVVVLGDEIFSGSVPLASTPTSLPNPTPPHPPPSDISG